MTIPTIISKTYCITSSAGCTVSTPGGSIILTVPENSQAYFVAPTSHVDLSDEDARVIPVP